MKAIASNGVEINTGDPVLVRLDNRFNWRYTFFSHKCDKGTYATCYGNHVQCIPYKGNEHLVGTNKDYKSYEDKFEFRFGAKVRAVCEDNSVVEGILIRYFPDYSYSYCIAINKQINNLAIGDIKWVKSIEYIE